MDQSDLKAISQGAISRGRLPSGLEEEVPSICPTTDSSVISSGTDEDSVGKQGYARPGTAGRDNVIM